MSVRRSSDGDFDRPRILHCRSEPYSLRFMKESFEPWMALEKSGKDDFEIVLQTTVDKVCTEGFMGKDLDASHSSFVQWVWHPSQCHA